MAETDARLTYLVLGVGVSRILEARGSMLTEDQRTAVTVAVADMLSAVGDSNDPLGALDDLVECEAMIA